MKKKNLTFNIFLALLMGITVGILVNLAAKDSGFVNDIVVNGFFNFLGTVFINLLKMLVVPLVFISLVCGSASISDLKKLGRVGGKTMAFYLVTTAVAIVLAMGVSYIINPGIGLDLSSIVKNEPKIGEKISFVTILLNMIPTNPIKAFAEGEMLQIIFFALMTGISLSVLGEKGKALLTFFEGLNELMLKMVVIVMTFAPIGVFGLIAKTFATLGFSAMGTLIKYMIAVSLALLIHMIVTYMGMLSVLGKLNPFQFFKNFAPAMSVAFSTASSSGTLPLTIETVEKKCGVSSEIASFTLPLGATINMDGTAIMQGVAVVFISQVYGIDLSLSQLLTVVLTATLASIGTAGVPSVGLVTLSMVLQSVGLPVEGIALIIGIDRILDMMRTVVNITGDAVCTLLIAKSEKAFDEEVFNS